MSPPPDRPLRVGIWTAVSSREQAADDKASLPDQEQAGRDLASALDARVVAVYRVPGHTRDIWDWHDAETDIPAYRALREDLQAGRLDLLWILDPDRAGRDPALAQQMFSLASKSGCEIYTATAPHPIGQQSPGHRYLYAIQAVRAGEDQALRVRRYHSGMTNRVNVRGLLPNTPPFWLDPVRDPVTGKTTSYQFNDRAAALDLITSLYLAGESYTEIARRLDRSPYPPPYSAHWVVATVRHILTHDTPAGLVSLAGVPRSEPSPAVPARWDPATFAAVVRERIRRAHGPRRRTESSPLAGVVYCARCGRLMTRCNSHNRRTLRCATHAARNITGRACHSNRTRETVIIDAIAAYLDTLATPANLEIALAHLDPDQTQTSLHLDLDRARTAAADLTQQRQRLALALAAGKLDPDLYRTTDDKLLAILQAEQNRILDITQLINTLPDLDQRRQILASIAATFRAWIQIAAPATVSATLQSAGLRVAVESCRVLRVHLS